MIRRRRAQEPGIVVFDASCLKYLVDGLGAEKIRQNCRVADLRVQITIPNVLEALKTENVQVRERLIQGMQQWLDGRPLLPWPLQILRLAAEALGRGDDDFVIRSTELEYLVFDGGASDDDHLKAKKFLERVEHDFAAAHSIESRKAFQTVLKNQLNPLRFATAADYLEAEAALPDVLASRAAMLWDAVELPGDPLPIGVLTQSEAWKIGMEALGLSIYYRSVRAQQQGNPAGLVDLFQLVYLSANGRKRILVTDDRSFAETANAILAGRYQNARVMMGADFLSA
ncbi:MAG TPA: hypothetical protein VGM67_01750 [Gemmatimonadaceae bacterium]|jgi:hypothetical protein